MARPKKNDEDRKSINIKVRLTEKDHERLKNVAEKFKMNASETIRALIKEADNIAQNW